MLDAADLFIGVNSLDYSGYPDCRPEFIEAFEIGTRVSVRINIQLLPQKFHHRVQRRVFVKWRALHQNSVVTLFSQTLSQCFAKA